MKKKKKITDEELKKGLIQAIESSLGDIIQESDINEPNSSEPYGSSATSNVSPSFGVLLNAKEFLQGKSNLSFIIGTDLEGQVAQVDIQQLRHLFVGGNEKLSCLYAIITSIIYKSNDKEVKLVIIDPTEIELSIYNGIPHLLLEVVTDPKKGTGALNWVFAEMTKRYKLFEVCKVNNLEEYNSFCSKMKSQFEELPQVLVIVNEFESVVNIMPDSVKTVMSRIIQMGAYAGIHLIISRISSTSSEASRQIIANIPSKIIFPLQRINCLFVSREEVGAVVYSLKLQGENLKKETETISIDDMTGAQFEMLCARLLSKKGYSNVSLTKASGDHGIDITCEFNGISYAIQCKRSSSNVGNSAVQQAYSGKGIYKKDIAVVITNGGFTKQAQEGANILGVKLWDRSFFTDVSDLSLKNSLFRSDNCNKVIKSYERLGESIAEVFSKCIEGSVSLINLWFDTYRHSTFYIFNASKGDEARALVRNVDYVLEWLDKEEYLGSCLFYLYDNLFYLELTELNISDEIKSSRNEAEKQFLLPVENDNIAYNNISYYHEEQGKLLAEEVKQLIYEKLRIFLYVKEIEVYESDVTIKYDAINKLQVDALLTEWDKIQYLHVDFILFAKESAEEDAMVEVFFMDKTL